MERTIRFRLVGWFSETTDTEYQVLGMDPEDMRYVLEMDDGFVLRMD